MRRVTGALLATFAADVHAHAFAQRYDLPLPLWHYLAGAGATVALSFFMVAMLVRPERWTAFIQTTDVSESAAWRWLTGRWGAGTLRVASVAIFLLVLCAGLAGPQAEPLDNLLPVTVWIVWWVGLTYACALVGDLWRVLNPWRIVAEWMSPRRRLPPSAEGNVWPGVVLFFAFCWAELVWPQNAVPWKLACAVLLYSAVTWIGMAAFGVEGWLRRGEAFNLFFDLVSRFAPVSPRGEVRLYGAGLVQMQALSPSQTAFVLIALSSVSFDGIRETPAWSELSASLTDMLYRAGWLSLIGNVGAAVLIKTAALALLPLAFFGAYISACRVMAAIVPGWTAATLARQFVLSLVPIAIAYHLAHYLSYLLIQGQAVVPLVSDPFGRGWDLFGTRGYEPDISLVDAGLVWHASVFAIVVGHAAAVLIAHVTALRLFRDARAASRSQYPLVALMVGYTILSLWILSQPIVEQ